MNRNPLGRARAFLSIFLSALVIAWAPGLAPYQALAGTISGGDGASTSFIGSRSLPTVKLGDLGTLTPPSLSAAPGLIEKSVVPATVSAPVAQAPAAPAVSAQAALAQGARQLQKAQASGGVRVVLEKLFSGAKAAVVPGGDVSGNDSGIGNDFSTPEARRYNETRR